MGRADADTIMLPLRAVLEELEPPQEADHSIE